MATLSQNTAIESALATLQPLKDLSRNWDVDIASCLEEYLHDIGAGHLIRHMEEGEDEPHITEENIPNFAHAALILQNSSSVYMRKVDYLHKLVYKALEEFCRNNASINKESSRRKSTDSDVQLFLDFDPHTEFLLLDDVVPEDLTNTEINLKSDDTESRALTSSTPNQSDVSARNRTRLSLGGLSVTRLERSITGGFTSSAQQRALMGTINNGSLRLFNGLCDVGDDGVLLMPGSALPNAVDDSSMPHDSEQTRRSLFGEAATDEAACFAPQQDAEIDDDDHSNDGPGFEMDFGGSEDERDANHGTGETEVGVVALQQQRRQVTFAEPSKTKPRVDPWALLDPHSDGNRKPKPLRRGRTIKLPREVDTLPSECVTGARTRTMPHRRRTRLHEDYSATKSLAAETFRSFLSDDGAPPKIPFNGLVFKEFTYIAKQNAKERSQQRRAERKKQAAELAAQPQDAGEANYESDDDYGDGYDFGGDDDDYDAGDNNGGNTGMASLDDAYDNNQNNHDDDDVSYTGKSFEELCRAHIQAFAKGAEKYALSTKLIDRVDKWQAKLAPILEDEERRSAFDIHMYSKQLIESAEEGLRKERVKRKSDGSTQAVTKNVSFGTVTENCTNSDVCRMFLASLSLANSGNLRIDETAESYSFDLMSNLVELPMETFQAPSLKGV
ncbi:unnamed protein product [Cylindrotheca closterium]|uniref:Condensin-2 complex subunit H2 n=1 Tax=Cylindrotheca closterium TaxID=2856 RepID=A0AAD2FBJ7_9STRA|nr:unnamed protein product [Cylindrotheca closterium]